MIKLSLGGGAYKKMGGIFFIFFFTAIQRAEGPSRWPKATSPPQELEVGAHRVIGPYLLVTYTNKNYIQVYWGKIPYTCVATFWLQIQCTFLQSSP